VVGLLLCSERSEADLGNLGPRDPPLAGLVEDGVGVLDRGPRIVADGGDRLLDCLVHPHGDRHRGPTGQSGMNSAAAVERRVHPDQDQLGFAEQSSCGPHRVADQALRASW